MRGVPLRPPIYVSGEAVSGKLAQPFAISDEGQPAGTAVSIDLVAGTVSLAAQK